MAGEKQQIERAWTKAGHGLGGDPNYIALHRTIRDSLAATVPDFKGAYARLPKAAKEDIWWAAYFLVCGEHPDAFVERVSVPDGVVADRFDLWDGESVVVKSFEPQVAGLGGDDGESAEDGGGGVGFDPRSKSGTDADVEASPPSPSPGGLSEDEREYLSSLPRDTRYIDDVRWASRLAGTGVTVREAPSAQAWRLKCYAEDDTKGFMQTCGKFLIEDDAAGDVEKAVAVDLERLKGLIDKAVGEG